MNKVIVHLYTIRTPYEAWIPLNYTFAQLKRDVASYCCVSTTCCRLEDSSSVEFIPNATVSSFLSNSIHLRIDESIRKTLSNAPPSFRKSLNFTGNIEEKAVKVVERPSTMLMLELREIFFTYILQGCSTDILLLKYLQFCRLMQDCDVTKKLSLEKLSLIFRKNSGKESGLRFEQLLDTLVDIATSISKNIDIENNNVSFDKLITRQILRKASNFRKLFSAIIPWDIQVLLIKNSAFTAVLKTFRETAQSFCPRQGEFINYMEFMRLMGDCNFVTLSISSQELSSIFLRCSDTLSRITPMQHVEVTADQLLHIFSHISLTAFPRIYKISNERFTEDLESLSIVSICLIKALFQHIARFLTTDKINRIIKRRSPSSNNLIANISSFQKHFISLWKKDGCPDYLSYAAVFHCSQKSFGAKKIRRKKLSNSYNEINRKHFTNKVDLTLDENKNNQILLSKASEENARQNYNISNQKLSQIIERNPGLKQFFKDPTISTASSVTKNPNFFELEYPSFIHEIPLLQITSSGNIPNVSRAEQLYMAASWLLNEQQDSRLYQNNLLDLWEMAGDEFNRVIGSLEEKLNELDIASVLSNWGSSLTFFARQALSFNFKLKCDYELLKDTRTSITLEENVGYSLALESLVLASCKFSSAMKLFHKDAIKKEEGPIPHLPSYNNWSKQQLNTLFQWANALCLHGEALELQEKQKPLKKSKEEEDELWMDDDIEQDDFLYYNLPLRTKSSFQLFEESRKRLTILVQLDPEWISARNNLTYAQYKLGMAFPRGHERSKRFLGLALMNAKTCASMKPVEDSYHLANKLIEAQLFVNQCFFSPQNPGTSSNDDIISPLYRLTIGFIFERFDVDKDNLLQLQDINEMNRQCGEDPITNETMEWLKSKVDSESNGITLKGFIEFFIYTAIHDPIHLRTILDALTGSKSSDLNEKLLRSFLHDHQTTSFKKEHRHQNSMALSNSMLHRASLHVDLNTSHIDEATCARLADYFLVISCTEVKADCNLSTSESPFDLALEPSVEHQFPLLDHRDTPLPQEIHSFCFPKGCFLASSSIAPHCLDFVLTDINGVKLYATGFYFYDKIDALQVLGLMATRINNTKATNTIGISSSNNQLPSWLNFHDVQQGTTDWKCFLPKCLCIISHYPFFKTFQDFLLQLYRISLSSLNLPIERYILNFMKDIPLPPRGKTRIQFTLEDKTYSLERPPLDQLPFTDVSFKPLFQCLSTENILKIYLCLLTEKKIALCSKNYSLLTPIAESFRVLLFPFECQTIYIPVLPEPLYEFLYAPVPFLMGIHSDYLHMNELIEDVLYVNLDNNSILVPPDMILPRLSEGKMKKILQQMKKISSFVIGNQSNLPIETTIGTFDKSLLIPIKEFSRNSHNTSNDLKNNNNSQTIRIDVDSTLVNWEKDVRLEFLNIQIDLFQDYRKYFVTKFSSDGIASTIFDKILFLNDHLSCRDFLSQMFETQLFERFIGQRLDITCCNLPSVLLFDEFINRRSNRPKYQTTKKESQHFHDTNYVITETFHASPPSSFGVGNQLYQYNGFPKLQGRLYGEKRQGILSRGGEMQETLSKTALLANAARLRVESSSSSPLEIVKDSSFISNILSEILNNIQSQVSRKQFARIELKDSILQMSLQSLDKIEKNKEQIDKKMEKQ